MQKAGVAAFLFFFIKGLVWLAIAGAAVFGFASAGASG